MSPTLSLTPQDPTAAMDNLLGFSDGFSIDNFESILDNLGGDILENIEALGENE